MQQFYGLFKNISSEEIQNDAFIQFILNFSNVITNYYNKFCQEKKTEKDLMETFWQQSGEKNKQFVSNRKHCFALDIFKLFQKQMIGNRLSYESFLFSLKTMCYSRLSL